MKRTVLFIIITISLLAFACDKDEESDRFKYLTTPVWEADSLLANGIDASGPGGILAIFNGNAKFNTDGTGSFGSYNGTWRFNSDETELVIITEALLLPVTTDIVELTAQSLKVTTLFPNPVNPTQPVNLRMTFKAK
jgi:hypothetical protein